MPKKPDDAPETTSKNVPLTTKQLDDLAELMERFGHRNITETILFVLVMGISAGYELSKRDNPSRRAQ